MQLTLAKLLRLEDRKVSDLNGSTFTGRLEGIQDGDKTSSKKALYLVTLHKNQLSLILKV